MGNDFSGSSILGAFGAVMGIIWLISMIMCVVLIVSQWKIFKKAGEPGVAAIVPFWNTAILFKITWGKWYYMFLTLIPFVGIVISFITYFKLAKVFGQSTGFGLGLLFLSVIFMPILAFGSAEYVGINGQISNENVPVNDTYDADEDDSDNLVLTESNMFAGDSDVLSNQDLEREQISQSSYSNHKSHSAGRHWSV